MRRNFALILWLLFVLARAAFPQANGKLQIHHIDVGQGDGAVLISPKYLEFIRVARGSRR